MTPARAEILRRIRAGLADIPTDETPETVPVHRDYHGAHHHDDLVALFAQRAADYRAHVHDVGPDELPSVLASIVRARIAVPPELPQPWCGQLDDTRLLVDGPTLTPADLDASDVSVVTGCAVGIAETGTVVLDHGPAQGRRLLTLIPDHHVVVLRADQVVADVPDALTRLDPQRPLTFISGPSATSDIELNRVEGVHGPRNLDILLVRE